MLNIDGRNSNETLFLNIKVSDGLWSFSRLCQIKSE